MARFSPTQLMNGASALVSGAAGLVGKAFGPVTKGVAATGAVLGTVWYGNKAFMGENGSASKMEARWQGAEASEAMHANTTGIKETFAGWLEILKDIFPSLAAALDPYIDRLRDNVVRPQQNKDTIESLSEVISPGAGVALAVAPATGLGVAAYSAMKGKKDAAVDTGAAAPVGSLADKKALSEMSKADQDRVTGKVKADAKGPAIIAEAVDDAAKGVKAKGFSLKGVFGGKANGALVIGGAALTGAAVYLNGASPAEAAVEGAKVVPGVDAGFSIANGDFKTAFIQAGGAVGGILGGIAGGVVMGAAGSVVPVAGTGAGLIAGGVAGGTLGYNGFSGVAENIWDGGEYVFSKGVDAVNYFWGDDEPEIKSEFAHAADNDNKKTPAYIADNSNTPVYKASGMDMVIN